MKLRIASAVAALVLAAAPAQAVITSITLSGGTAFTNGGTGQIVAAPADVSTTITGNNVFGFNERQNVSLGAAQATRPQAFLFATGANGVVPQVRVSSHAFVFFPTAGRSATGTISFNQNVIAIQRGSGQINAARSNQLETGLTDFTNLGGLEAGDIITRTGAKTISFNLQASATGQDVFRVITAVPEASTWAMMLTGFGLVGVGARRRRAAVAA